MSLWPPAVGPTNFHRTTRAMAWRTATLVSHGRGSPVPLAAASLSPPSSRTPARAGAGAPAAAAPPMPPVLVVVVAAGGGVLLLAAGGVVVGPLLAGATVPLAIAHPVASKHNFSEKLQTGAAGELIHAEDVVPVSKGAHTSKRAERKGEGESMRESDEKERERERGD